MITRYIILLFGLLTILSCQKEEDIITPIKLPVVSTQVLMTSLSGWVTSDPGFRSILYNVKFINRANVRLIHDGIVLDETSTNLEGFYSHLDHP